MPGNEDWALVRGLYISTNGRCSYEELVARGLNYDVDARNNGDGDSGYGSGNDSSQDEESDSETSSETESDDKMLDDQLEALDDSDTGSATDESFSESESGSDVSSSGSDSDSSNSGSDSDGGDGPTSNESQVISPVSRNSPLQSLLPPVPADNNQPGSRESSSSSGLFVSQDDSDSDPDGATSTTAGPSSSSKGKGKGKAPGNRIQPNRTQRYAFQVFHRVELPFW